MREPYIGLFSVAAPGKWHVCFPDLPGCAGSGRNFKEVFDAARRVLTTRLKNADKPAPRARSTVELLIDAQRDECLRRQVVNAAMHPVSPATDDDMAPLELVAWRGRRGSNSNPEITG
jgi:predicted RNase H-like HicB family nuclease